MRQINPDNRSRTSDLEISVGAIYSLPSVHQARMAQWIRRLPTEQEILGSSPSTGFFFSVSVYAFGHYAMLSTLNAW